MAQGFAMSIFAAASSAWAARETLAASVIVSQRLQAALVSPSLLILRRSQWRCLANSYCIVTQALDVLLEHVCSVLVPWEHENMCCKLTGPLHALHQAVQEGETACMLESLPSSSSNSTHSWLLEKALRQSMSTDVVDLHLHHLLWTSSVVRDQILRSAPNIERMETGVIEHITRKLCEIWSLVDTQDDFLSARTLLNRIMSEEEEGDTHQLASFILQKLSWAETYGRITDIDDLPPFLWVNPEDLKRIADPFGEGAYGKVQEAVWLKGHFAVKDFVEFKSSKTFGREATIQAQLCHPNVIPLVCCTKNPSKNNPFKINCSVVMELMQHDLHDLMMQRMGAGMETPFPLLVAVDLMLQIAKGMEYLHSDGLRIMHRDLKSSNVLVSFSGRAGVSTDDVISHVHLKVADFGVSKAKHTSSRYSSQQVGSTAWRAPEVFEDGEEGNARYTNKADVYSFSLVCYEILTGKAPFEGITQIQRRVLSGERPTLPMHCPLALSSYIRMCWDINPDQRPTFTQICRMLRYFKACIILHNHNAAEYDDFLLRPLFPSACARIDGMFQGFEQRLASTIQPQPLAIPYEMYCCRVVLQILEVQRSGMEPGESRQPARRYFRRTLKWLRKLSLMNGTPGGTHEDVVFSELRDTLGNLVGYFRYEELRLATNNFSSLIGESGSGRRVYLGQLVDGRRVAVKVSYNNQPSIYQELRIASQLRHQNMVPLYGWCQERGNIYLVYEYMPNGNLAGHIFSPELDEDVLGWQERYKVVGQVAAALKYLHQDSGNDRQIVHRDVKTSNILLDSEWNARLDICNLAIIIRGDSTPEYCPVAGTVGFLPPEMLSNNYTVSPASDIYSFGMTVLEIATGRRAWETCLPIWVAYDIWVREVHQQGEVLWAADVRPTIDEGEMRRLLMLGLACTDLDPQARPTIDEVLRILSTPPDTDDGTEDEAL